MNIRLSYRRSVRLKFLFLSSLCTSRKYRNALTAPLNIRMPEAILAAAIPSPVAVTAEA